MNILATNAIKMLNTDICSVNECSQDIFYGFTDFDFTIHNHYLPA